MKRILTISLALGAATLLSAQPNVPRGNMKAKMAEAAGEKGPFAKDEHFPKDYFLIPKNLPYAVGLTLYHPESSSLGLSEEQIKKIEKIKADTDPVVIKSAKKIKALELKLADQMIKGAKATDMEAEVDKIASLKASLTKIHLKCIESVMAMLTPKQKGRLMTYAGRKMPKKKKAHKVTGLVPLPHPVKLLFEHEAELKITKKQKERIEKELVSVYPEKIHGNMDKAKAIEETIKKAVLAEHKTSEVLKPDIEELVKVKKAITHDHIDALNLLGTILREEQFDKLLALSKKGHRQ